MQNHTRRHAASEDQGSTAELIQSAILPQIPAGFNRTLQVCLNCRTQLNALSRNAE